MGLGNKKKITPQHAAPARNGIQVTSALPEMRKMDPRAITAPAQTGNSRIAIQNLSHFNTCPRLSRENSGAEKKFGKQENSH
jgi:hypothetical protein